MPIGEITSVTVPHRSTAGLAVDGGFIDLEIEGFDEGVECDLGSGFGNPLHDADLSNASITLLVTSSGYSTDGTAENVSRTLVATHVARRPFPNQAEQDQAATASGVRIRLWLAANIYEGDTVVATVRAGAFRNLAGNSEDSLGASEIAVTNEASLPYPRVTAKLDEFAGVVSGDRVNDDFRIAVNAVAGHGISSVVVTATGGTSGHQQTVIVTSPTGRQRPASGLSASAYEAAVPINGFQQGKLIDCDFTVYPKVGDANSIVSTVGRAISTDEILGRNRVTLICDKNRLLDEVRHVRIGGDDGSGDGSEAAPFATIGRALQSGANVVELGAGVHALGNLNARIASLEWAVIRPVDGADKDSVIVEINELRTYRHQRLRIQGCRVTLKSSSSWLDGEHQGNHIEFRDCHMDSQWGGPVSTPTVGPGYRSDSCRFVNCSGDLGAEHWAVQSFSSSRIAYSFDGCELVDSTTTHSMNAWFHVVACKSIGQNSFRANSVASFASSVPEQDGVFFAWNQFTDFRSSGRKILTLGETAGQPNHNAAIVGNVIEKTAGTSPAMAIAGDGTETSSQPTNDIKLIANTIAGERVNLSYNDGGPTGWERSNWFMIGNSFHQMNIKADMFNGGNGQRTGGWPLLNGINCHHNHYRDGDLFAQEGRGRDTTYGTPSNPLEPGYVDDRSGVGGAGGGDYTPTNDSILVDRILPGVLNFGIDLAGSPYQRDIGGLQHKVSSVPNVESVSTLNLRFRP
ncbi:hypothetical protein KOR42_23970 [Thalassoglobus neptunius]|uniref:Uncharacterized protein n=1 Tax=Thalassoglobus neptunius TaxID=1938619 RepID=A0A5C5X8G4_9PLAN|nr:hypothetical protein [Thalassoglobus neptunius]TWT59009.1 hypothetical protein KOR42_23970 [Thalassoglobus neptunius]